MEEIWKEVKNYEMYQVSNFGNVKSMERQSWNGKSFYTQPERILKPSSDGVYLKVSLCKNNKSKSIRVHQLVAQEFLNKPNIVGRIEVDHIDGNKFNNNLYNLQYLSQRDNTIKGIKRKKTSRYTGVIWHKYHNKWVSSYTIEGVTKYKYFTDELEAAEYYNKKISEYYV